MIRDGRLLFAAPLTEDNIEVVRTLLDQVLAGKRYTMVTANELFHYKPEVRTGMTLRQGSVGLEGERGDGIGRRLVLDDEDYVTSLWTSSSKGVDVIIHEDVVQVSQHAPGGNHIWWTWRPEHEDDPTVWRLTRKDVLDRCSGERVLPITDEQFERIAKAIDYSSVSECIEGAIGQVVPYIPDPDDEEPS